ncbi:helix-turn-helix transcriptional regulator [Calderihabitans maritimus]|nr:helix-turn-helix transcriptional regulator [Calderihabitans maritimus]
MCGRHRRRGCRCINVSVERFMEPCLLLLLSRRSTYGYDLIQSLKEFGFADGETDPGTVYRYLRRMEEEGLVSSEWDTSGGGPARRLYTLTSEGEDLLHAWAESIKENKKRLEYFLQKYREQFPDD